MKKSLFLIFTLLAVSFNACNRQASDSAKFMRVEGPDIIAPDGSKFFIKGTNLGNWLNPEGYMFGFSKCNSAHFINEMLCQLVGEESANEFWKEFKDNYITRKDIEFIAAQGANTIRLPFHYKLFTDDDYMGSKTDDGEGFARIDSVVSWCRDNNLALILDMHDAPGGQTGDNIDDSYGYPWLFESEAAQQEFCDIWKRIATRYANEPVILGYELINEPIPHYMPNKEELNGKLEPLHKRAVAAIREVDKNHIILLGAPQWNSNFEPFTDWKYDDNIMYTCHRYGGPATAEAIASYIEFRDKTNLPMYMGEIGHNSDEWQADFVMAMEDNNIGYTFWPFKKVDNSCMNGIVRPDGWDSIVVSFAEAPRSTYAEIQKARPDQATSRRMLKEFVEASRFENCVPQTSYIESINLK